MTTPLLSVNKLNTYFYSQELGQLTQTLFDISFELYAGETLGIIGESGSGKTVTLLSLLGLVDANPGICSGEIVYKNHEATINPLQNIEKIIAINYENNALQSIEKNTEQWKKLIEPEFRKVRGKLASMIFQNPRLAFNPYISIGRQINETIRLHTDIKDKNAAKEKAIEWLGAVKMDAPHIRYNNNPYGLSGGMCQRALIAMALSAESDIIIADEPTSGLDATIQSDILDLLVDLKNTYRKSIVMVSHDLNVMQKVSDRILVYYHGNIIESGDTSAVLANSQNNHPYTTALIHASSISTFREENTEHKALEHNPSACPYLSHCPHADELGERCATQKPPLFTVSDKHKIACWRFEHD